MESVRKMAVSDSRRCERYIQKSSDGSAAQVQFHSKTSYFSHVLTLLVLYFVGFQGEAHQMAPGTLQIIPGCSSGPLYASKKEAVSAFSA